MHKWETEKPYYTVAVDYYTDTDVLEGMHYNLEDALKARDSVIDEAQDPANEHWQGLRYVYVIVNERRWA
jgi:hypothetical protein